MKEAWLKIKKKMLIGNYYVTLNIETEKISSAIIKTAHLPLNDFIHSREEHLHL